MYFLDRFKLVAQPPDFTLAQLQPGPESLHLLLLCLENHLGIYVFSGPAAFAADGLPPAPLIEDWSRSRKGVIILGSSHPCEELTCELHFFQLGYRILIFLGGIGQDELD